MGGLDGPEKNPAMRRAPGIPGNPYLGSIISADGLPHVSRRAALTKEDDDAKVSVVSIGYQGHLGSLNAHLTD